jgi:predicted DNA-binding protein (UPF0251 family)
MGIVTRVTVSLARTDLASSAMADTPPAFLESKEAAALLGVSEASFLRLVHQGKIQIAANALIPEGKLYFLRTDLLRLKNKQPGS